MTNRTHTTVADRSLGELVQEDCRVARVFEHFDLDFCCNGHRTLREATDNQGVSLDEIVGALAGLGDPGAEQTDSRRAPRAGDGARGGAVADHREAA